MLVPMSTARTKLYGLVRKAEAGEDIVLTYRGRPVAKMVPASGARAKEA